MRSTRRDRRRFLSAMSALAVAPAMPAFAQTYPSRTIRLIYSFPAGSGQHTTMLFLAQEASTLLGQPMIVEVKPGAGGRIGLDEALRSPPNGYVIAQASNAMLVLQGAIDPKLKIEPEKDYAPIIPVTESQWVMVVHPSMPFRDVKGFVEYAKTNPGKLSIGAGSVNSDAYLGMLRFKQITQTDFVLVPFGGQMDGLTAQLNGLLQVSVLTGIVKQHIDSGKMIGMATTGARRWDLFPTLPTLMEAGVDLSMVGLSTLVAPKGTPEAIINRLNQVFASIIARPEAKKTLAEFGLVPRGDGTPQDLTKAIRSAMELWTPIVQKSGIKTD